MKSTWLKPVGDGFQGRRCRWNVGAGGCFKQAGRDLCARGDERPLGPLAGAGVPRGTELDAGQGTEVLQAARVDQAGDDGAHGSRRVGLDARQDAGAGGEHATKHEGVVRLKVGELVWSPLFKFLKNLFSTPEGA